MSSNLNLPPPANKVGGMRLPAPYRAPKTDEDAATPQTNVETALSSSSGQQSVDKLEQALGLHLDQPTPAVRDQAEHPKANASTYHPPQPQHLYHVSSRANAYQPNRGINQPGGAHNCNRY